MKVDFSRELTTFDGEPIKIQGLNEGVTLGFICGETLLAVDDKATLTDQMKRYTLAQDIHRSKEPIELTLDQAKDIKDRLVKRWPIPMLCAQAAMMLEE